MSINTAFYQIAKNVAASDLAKIIGAKIIGIETAMAEKAVIKDIAPFHCFRSTLVHQIDQNCWLISKLKQPSLSRTRPERRRWVQKILFSGSVTTCWVCARLGLFNLKT